MIATVYRLTVTSCALAAPHDPQRPKRLREKPCRP